jgi:hypothetical protein
MKVLNSPAPILGVAPVIALSGGSIWIVVVALLSFVAIVIGWYTRKGSGIGAHPYGKIYSGAPGAKAHSSYYITGRRDDAAERPHWSRGTR